MSAHPYGTWSSPVSEEMLTGATVGLSAPRLDGTDLYWLEARADEGGRTGLWRRSTSGALTEVTPAPFNVRTRVNEYGGGEYAVADGIVVFSDLTDGRLYRVGPAGDPEPITPAEPLRYGDLRVFPTAGLVLAVREDHRGDGEAVTTLVRLDLDGDNLDGGVVLCTGADFYADPQLGADGRLAWTQWDHPNMPWDSTEIRVGELSDDERAPLSAVRTVAGGTGESAVYPRWMPDGRLVFCSDRTDWWNLYVTEGTVTSPDATALLARDAEFCLPAWQLGAEPYVVLDERRVVSVVVADGSAQLALVDVRDASLTPLLAEGESAAGVVSGGGLVAAVIRSTTRPARIAVRDLVERTWTTVRSASETRLDPDVVSVAQAVSWTGAFGEVHGWYYPPTNAATTAPEGERPPLIVEIHGGPTAMAGNAFALGYQFWTSRGIALLDVNYGGSTGYGRAYRARLQGNWGVVDVDDCVSGARAMADQGLADPDRLVISGGSAGGYTTLRALTTSDAFAAGISLYGVADLEALARDTHKFESRYLDGLVGPYPADAAVYRDRSPIHHVDDLASPILLLQGADDAVVPPNQAVTMADAVRAKGLPVALIIFPGEGHGFRRAETIHAAVRAELTFLGRVLGFAPADDLPDLDIDNL